MNLSYSARPGREVLYLVTFLAVMAGLLIIELCYLGQRWMICGMGLLFLIAGSIVAPNVKHFVLTLFFLTLPIGATNFLGTLDDFHYGGAAGLYHTVYDVFLMILYLLWIPGLLIKRNEKIHISASDICFWLIIFMAFLSMHNAAAPQFSVYEIVRLVVMYMLFLYMANLNQRAELKIILIALLFGLFAESILGVVQYVTGGFLGLGLLGERSTMMTFNEISRVGGTLGHPNGFARYLGFLIPLTMSLTLAPIKGKYKTVCGFLALFGMVALILTYSRAAWGGLGLSLIVMIVLGLIARLISWRKAFVLTVVGLLGLSLLVFSFREEISTRLFTDDSGSMASRVPQIEIASNIIKAHPVIGIGINNYAEVMHLYDNTSERITSWFPNVVHNVYLLIASEIGIPGLCFFLLFIFLFYRAGFQVLRGQDQFSKALAVGIMAGVTAFLIQILVMPPTLTSSSFLFFWVLAGLMMAIRRQEKPPTPLNHGAVA